MAAPAATTTITICPESGDPVSAGVVVEVVVVAVEVVVVIVVVVVVLGGFTVTITWSVILWLLVS